jgi:ankyrin repeat protein
MKPKIILCLALVCLFRCAPVNAEEPFEKELFVAVRNGDVDTVSKLLVKNPKLINSRNPAGMSALIESALNGDQKMAELLISKGADVNEQDDGGQTALYISTESHLIKMMELLLNHNAKVDVKNSDGNTPFRIAVDKGYMDAAKLLLENGADINTTNSIQWSPLLAAACNTNKAMVKWLLANKAREDIFSAICLGDTNHVAEILKDDSSAINVKRNGYDPGSFPLHWAALKNQTKIAEMLLAHGADVNATDESLGTPLHDAVAFGHYGQVQIARMLLAHGANINAKSNYGETPLHEAIWNQDLQMVTLLLNSNANVNAVMDAGHADDTRQTPLHYAAERGNLEIVKLLLDRGANPDARDSYGETPVAIAQQKGHYDVVDSQKGTTEIVAIERSHEIETHHRNRNYFQPVHSRRIG